MRSSFRRFVPLGLGVALVLTTTIALGVGLPTTTISGGAVTAVKAVRSDNLDAVLYQQGESTSNRPWVDVPTASATLTVPKRQNAFFLVTFVNRAVCNASYDGGSASSSSGWGCLVRAVVDGTAGAPSQFTELAGSVEGGGQQSEQGLFTVQFSTAVVGPGSHTVKIQYKTGVGDDTVGVQMRISEMHLSVERVRA
jgi:hypothetical protein